MDSFGPRHIDNIPFGAALSARPPRFTGVIPFRGPFPHYQTIYPPHQALALELGIQPLYACSKAILDLPSEDIPLGSIRYDFREGIRTAFSPLNELVRGAYTNTLVVLDIHDFLDGRVVTTYGYLSFLNGQVFALYQGYHFDDEVRSRPHLLSYCLAPRLPLDPFDFITTFSDNEAL